MLCPAEGKGRGLPILETSRGKPGVGRGVADDHTTARIRLAAVLEQQAERVSYLGVKAVEKVLVPLLGKLAE